jgi:hypothetical protein
MSKEKIKILGKVIDSHQPKTNEEVLVEIGTSGNG